MRLSVMFITAVCVLFLVKLPWPKKRSIYDIYNEIRPKLYPSTNNNYYIKLLPLSQGAEESNYTANSVHFYRANRSCWSEVTNVFKTYVNIYDAQCDLVSFGRRSFYPRRPWGFLRKAKLSERRTKCRAKI